MLFHNETCIKKIFATFWRLLSISLVNWHNHGLHKLDMPQVLFGRIATQVSRAETINAINIKLYFENCYYNDIKNS